MKPLQYSEKAIENLEKIHDRIAEDNPLRADTFLAEILHRLAAIPLFPLAAPQRPGGTEADRVIRFGDYLIAYTIEPERILVTAAIHAAQDVTQAELH